MSTTVNPVRISIPERLRRSFVSQDVTVVDVYEHAEDNPQIVLTRIVEGEGADRRGWLASTIGDDRIFKKCGLQPEWKMWWVNAQLLAEHYPHVAERWQVGDTLTVKSPWTIDGAEVSNTSLTLGDWVTYEGIRRDNLVGVSVGAERYTMDASCLKRVPDEPAADEPATDESERIREQAEEIERLKQNLARAEIRHREDVERIGETLMREADYREWCSEYDEIVGQINSSLQVPLPTRHVSAAIQFVVTVQVDGATGDLRQRIIDEDGHWLTSTFSFGVEDDGDAAESDYFITSVSVSETRVL